MGVPAFPSGSRGIVPRSVPIRRLGKLKKSDLAREADRLAATLE